MNRKVIYIIVGFVVVVGGMVGLVQSGVIGMSNIWLDGEKEEAKRGDLVIPVTAVGNVEAAQLIQIKSKASGVVMEIPVREGTMVKRGDLLVKLDPVDEQRTVEARQAELNRAQSAWEKAKIALAKQKVDLPLATIMAKARLKDAEARLKDADFRYLRLKNMDPGVVSQQELISAEATFMAGEAARDIAKVDLDRANNDEVVILQSSEEDVTQAKAAHDAAQKNWEEAKQRLTETEVRASTDSMVYSIQAREGETIQGGTATFTGGTPLMVLADVNSMFVMAQIDEADIGEIRAIAPNYARPGESELLLEAEYVRRAKAIINAAEADGEELSDEQKKEVLKEKLDESLEHSGIELKGRPVNVTVEAYRGEEFKGVIERILPEPQRASNAVTFKVRIRLVGDDLTKLMGMQADLEFETETINDVVLVKNEALASEGRVCYVYVPHREGNRGRWGEKKIKVKIGKTDGTFTEITEGIEAGQEVWIKRPQFTDKEKREQGNA